MPSLKVQALEDIWAFCDLIKFKGGSQNFSAVHYDLAKFTTRPQREQNPELRRRITFVAREHLKSTINTTLYVLWRLYRNPDLRILVGTNTKKLSQSFIRELRQYFENTELQERVWNARPHLQGRMIPHLSGVSKRTRKDEDDTEALDKKVLWNAQAIQLVRTSAEKSIMKEPSVFACSVGMQLTGDHYDIVILDDIVDFDNSRTPTLAMSVEEWAQDLESVLTKHCEQQYITPHFSEWVGDEMIINGTPYYKHDYYHTQFLGDEKPETIQANLAEKEYCLFMRNVYKNGKDKSDGYTYPEKFDDLVVARLKKRLKPRRFAAQYLLTIIAGDDVSLDSSRIQTIAEGSVAVLGGNIINVRVSEHDIRPVRLYMCIDLAVAKKSTSDDAAIAVGGRDHQNNFYLVDLICKKMKPSVMIKEVHRLADKWQLNNVTVEKGGYQEAFADNLRDSFVEYRPLVIKLVYHQGDKKDRIEYHLEPLLTNNMFYILPWIRKHTPLEEQIDMFPSENAKDDAIDVTSMSVAESTMTNKNLLTTSHRSASRHTTINRKYGGTR